MRLALTLRLLTVLLLLAAIRPALAAEEVVVYSSVDEENAKKLLDAFTKATGVQVRFTFLSSGPAVARLEAEKANPRADVWFGAPSENHVVAKEKGLTQPYVSPNAKDLAAHFWDKDGHWTSFYMNPLALGVNTKILKERGASVPTSWEDLLRPELRNQIQMPSPQTSGTGYNMVAALVQMWGEDRAFEYLRKLHPNVQTYTQSGTAPSKAAAIGQAAIGIQFTPAFLQLADEGYPMQLAFPKEGVGFEAPAISIGKGAPHLDAAKKLVDWFLTVDGQNTITDTKTYFFPVSPKAKLAKGLPPFDQIPLMSYDAVRAGQDKKRLAGGAALAVILLVPSVTAFLVQRYWIGRKRYVTVTGKPARSSLKAVSPLARWCLFAVTARLALAIAVFYAVIVVGAFSRTWGVDHTPTLRNFGYVVGVGLATAELSVADGTGAGLDACLAVLRPEAIRLLPALAADPGQPRGRVRRTVYLGDVAEYEVEAGPAALLVSVANPVAEGLFAEGDAVAIALPAHPVALVPAS